MNLEAALNIHCLLTDSVAESQRADGGGAHIPQSGGLFRRALGYIAQWPPALPLASANSAMVPFFSCTAGPTSASLAAGAESQESDGGGVVQIDNCVH